VGILSAFKLWIQDDKTFQASSDIIMLFSNFLIAAITLLYPKNKELFGRSEPFTC